MLLMQARNALELHHELEVKKKKKKENSVVLYLIVCSKEQPCSAFTVNSPVVTSTNTFDLDRMTPVLSAKTRPKSLQMTTQRAASRYLFSLDLFSPLRVPQCQLRLVSPRTFLRPHPALLCHIHPHPGRSGRRPRALLREHQSSRVPVFASRYEVPAQKALMSPPPMS